VTGRTKGESEVTSLAFPAAEEAVVCYLVERMARTRSGLPCASDDTGEQWSWAEGQRQMEIAAAGLARAGVTRGDFVGVMLPNSLDWVRAWWGLSRAGAVFVAINPAFRGEVLRHVCTDSGLRRVVATAALADRVHGLGLAIEIIDPSQLRPAGDAAPRPAEVPVLDPPLEPWDVAGVNYTSGTTGPSKGVLMTNAHLWWSAPDRPWENRPDDVLLMHVPLFHTGGQSPTLGVWKVGGSVTIRPHFRAATFLDDARRAGATLTSLVASMSTHLVATPPRDDDADNPLRSILCVPVPSDPEGFMKRFGLDELWVMYGMTELPAAMHEHWRGSVTQPQAVGRPRDGYELRIVDDHDLPVTPGQPGQLLVRCELPWTITVGYLNRPEATAEAWRNGWFHTGDIMRMDEDGYYFFVDRATDSVRRRGEHISTFEVEQAIAMYPGIREVACIGIADEHGDSEVKAHIAIVAPAAEFDPADLIKFLRDKLPYFTIPRYVEVLDELPKTPTAKIQKFALRERGITEGTWDREAAGIVIKRDY